jgi:hypothetical protein
MSITIDSCILISINRNDPLDHSLWVYSLMTVSGNAGPGKYRNLSCFTLHRTQKLKENLVPRNS